MIRDQNRIGQQRVVVEYQTPAQRRPGNATAIFAFICAVLSAAPMFVATDNALLGRVLLVLVIVGAGGGFGGGVVALRQAASREGAGRGLAWLALIISGAIIALLVAIIVIGFILSRA